jgi:hypothetical protein
MHLTQLLALVLVLASHNNIVGECQSLHAAVLVGCASLEGWPLNCCHICTWHAAPPADALGK